MARWTSKKLKATETEDTKYCPQCKKVKPLLEFYFCKVGTKFTQGTCIKCEKERSKERHIFKDFGITLKDYDKILEKQDNGCKICGIKIPGGQGRFHIDHDHVTGKIRGLLCSNCNLALGNAKDDIKILAAMIQYLIDSREQI